MDSVRKLVFGNITHTEGLVCKTHIHDFGRVAVTGSQIDQPAFSYDIDAPVAKIVFFYVVSYGPDGFGKGSKGFHINFHVEVAGICKDCSVRHGLEIFGCEDIAVSCGGNKDFT